MIDDDDAKKKKNYITRWQGYIVTVLSFQSCKPSFWLLPSPFGNVNSMRLELAHHQTKHCFNGCLLDVSIKIEILSKSDQKVLGKLLWFSEVKTTYLEPKSRIM